jgi:hypothetical protein
MSSREFAEWTAFFQLQPYGEWRADYRMACLMALIANVNRDPKSSRAYEPQEFMPQFDAAENASDQDLVAMKVDAYFSALAGKT